MSPKNRGPGDGLPGPGGESVDVAVYCGGMKAVLPTTIVVEAVDDRHTLGNDGEHSTGEAGAEFAIVVASVIVGCAE